MKKYVLMTALLLSLCGSVWAKSIDVEGVAATAKGAEREALRNAVENAVGTYVGSMTLTEKYKVIQDSILTHSQGYVSDYQVLERRQRRDGLWRVKLRAEIDETADAKLLSELARQGIINIVLRNPKIDVMINYGENSAVGNWTAVALAEELVGTGFKRAAIGERDDPDFVIRGYAKYSDGGDVGQFIGDGKKRTGTKSARVTVAAELHQMSTGKTIALGSKTVSAVAAGKEYALQKAAHRVGSEMGKYIVEQLLILGSGPALKEEKK
ncbi:MAG: hypothetical protein MJ041_03270 [Acidaminococcaceae bacterium]|nr:hypothetical protein [Acidaminococcaceae bacterium]